MDLNKLTIKSQQALEEAQKLVTQFGQTEVHEAHLLKGMMLADQNVMPHIFSKFSVNTTVFEQALNQLIQSILKFDDKRHKLFKEQ